MNLYNTNDQVDKHNNDLFDHRTAHKYVIPAADMIDTEVSTIPCGGPYEDTVCMARRFTGGLESSLKLFDECTVMVTTNVNVKDGLVNGSCGTFKGVTTSRAGAVKVIWVHFPNTNVGLTKKAQSVALYRKAGIQATWTPLHRVQRKFDVSKEKVLTHIVRKQFPICPRGASTIHKTQGLTLTGGYVDFEGRTTAGLCYVAFSRFIDVNSLQVVNFSVSQCKSHAGHERHKAKTTENHSPPPYGL